MIYSVIVSLVFCPDALFPGFNISFGMYSVGFVLIINAIACYFLDRKFFSLENLLDLVITFILFVIYRIFFLSIVNFIFPVFVQPTLRLDSDLNEI